MISRVLPVALVALVFIFGNFPQNLSAADDGVCVTLTATFFDFSIGTINNDYQTVRINQDATYNFAGEYNGWPETTAETKPGSPEWKFSSVTCSPNESEVTYSLPTPKNWTPGPTISGSDTVKSSKEGQWSLTYKASVRFPKLNTSDGTHVKDKDGNLLYYGPYSASATVILKVTAIPFKAWIVSTDDNFPGHSLYKLGLLEAGEIQIANLDPNDPPVTFSKAELKEGAFATLENRNVTAKTSAGSVIINVWAEDSAGTEFGPEELTVTVVKPDGINFVRGKTRGFAGKKTRKDTASVGFKGIMYLTPSDVSFAKLKAYEGMGDEAEDDGIVSASGFFQLYMDAQREKCQPLWAQIDKLQQDKTAPGLSEEKKEEIEQKLIGCQNQLTKIQKINGVARIEPDKFFWHGGPKPPKRLAVLPGLSIQSCMPNTLDGYDTIFSGVYHKGKYGCPDSPGFIEGILSWNIAYSYIVGEKAEPVKNFARKIGPFTISPEGNMTIRKGSGYATATFEEGDLDYSDRDPNYNP